MWVKVVHGGNYSQMFIQIKNPRGLEIIARWGHLPISMKSEIGDADIKIREHSTILVCKSNNSEEDWIVIVVIDAYSCFLIDLLCQTKHVCNLKD